MGWTLGGIASQGMRGASFGRARWIDTAPRARAIEAASQDRPDVFARAFSRRLSSLEPAEREAVELAVARVKHDAPVIERIVATGAPVQAVERFSRRWGSLEPKVRAFVRDPLALSAQGRLNWLGEQPVQVDSTTCGAASLSMMLAITDPLVAAWIARGVDPGYLPKEVLDTLESAEPGDLDSLGGRWEALQRTMHKRATMRALGPAPWPRSLGTPPWRVDNVLRCAGLRFRGHVVDDSNAPEFYAMIDHLRAAVSDGIPCPVYVSGDSRKGIDTVIPRHVVLAVGVEGEAIRLYEPSSGAVVDWNPRTADFKPLKAFGGWSRVAWVVLPRWAA